MNGAGLEAEMNVAWQQREEARRHLRAEPHNSNFQKAVKIVEKKLRKVRKAAVLIILWDVVRKLETRTREGDQAVFHKHLKAVVNTVGGLLASRRVFCWLSLGFFCSYSTDPD